MAGKIIASTLPTGLAAPVWAESFGEVKITWTDRALASVVTSVVKFQGALMRLYNNYRALLDTYGFDVNH